ncbi:hypothetical protein [Nocardia huaxiensis]|uniref:Uncharacterized protein n=1 Tax=Nocardia huaxiensis TaxID=2755382 RepID=A0A7D6ZQT2_9NOCA|nr:hypothetical protein [Nocardia huaxiensis]QLY31465.1 hypothetical protein H0264_03715 [Nocardia huaxiensis]UFS95015.1 hypothetical protein LPY97_30550 [Nocardia huaxiensis]
MLQDRLNEFPTGTLVYGQPYETADGSTVITVATNGRLLGARPLGVFVVHGGEVKWQAAVDETRIALLAVLSGLIAAGLTTAALFKRPPWPDLRIIQRH